MAYKFFAPDARIPSIAAWSLARTRLVAISCGFFSVSVSDLTMEEACATYFIHETKNNLVVVCKSPSQFMPELTKLCGCGSLWVRRIANDTSRERLLRGIIVSHVVMRIQNSVPALGHCNIVDSICKEAIVLKE